MNGKAKILRVPDIHCEHCVSRIRTALGAAKIEAEVDLISKTVTVPASDAVRVKSILNDLGFKAR